MTMFGWVGPGGVRFSLLAWDWGLVRDAGCCGRPCSLIAASPSALKMNIQYCLGEACSWCRRPQAPEGAGVEQGQPHFPKRLGKFPALAVPVVPALELPLAGACGHPTPSPSTSCSMFSSCFRQKGPGSHRGAPVAQAAFAPSNSQFPASGTKFYLLICVACPGPGKSPWWAWTWTLLKLAGICCR
jgi:hypothetical protein